MKSETFISPFAKKSLMSLKKSIKKNDEWKLTKRELRERNTTLKSDMESMTEISTKLNSQSNLKSKAEFKNNKERKKKRKRKRRLRRCFITQRLSKKCTGQKFLKRKEEKLKLIELNLKTKTKSSGLQANLETIVMKDHQVQTKESINLLIGKTWETQWSLQQKKWENDLSLSKSTT